MYTISVCIYKAMFASSVKIFCAALMVKALEYDVIAEPIGIYIGLRSFAF